MSRFAQLILLLGIVLGTAPAKAALLLEPVAGFSFAGGLDFDGGESYTGINGSSYGGRVGFQKLGFQLGIDYLHSNFTMRDDDFGTTTRADEWGGFVGFEFPVFFRVYAGYIFSATAEGEYENQDIEFSKGNGSRVGLGLTFLPLIDINIEYRAGKYDEWKQGDTVNEDKVKFRAWMISLSLPITI